MKKRPRNVWLLNFDKTYPYIRVVETIATGDQLYGTDQISIYLSEGVDVIELKPMLDELGLRLGMFNRKGLAVIGVLNNQIDAVPSTIEAFSRGAICLNL